MKKIFRQILIVVSLFFSIISEGFAQIVINEYQCSNRNSYMDNTGEFEDWFELFNTTGNDIDISGYYLSDKVSNPTKYQIPNGVSVPANGYLMVIASGKSGMISGQLHTSFKLTQTKPETIMLSNQSVINIDFKELTPNQLGHSTGRTTDGASTWNVFDSATPGSANTDAKQYAATPIFDQQAGKYSSSISVNISNSEPNSEIRFTTDGSEPNSFSTLYSGAINISNTTILRARVFSSDANVLPSFIETNSYFIGVNHQVKVISICGGDYGGDELMDLLNGDQIDPAGHFELFERDFTFLTESSGDFNKHGNDSWAYDQRGIDFISRDEYGYNYAIEDEIFNGKSRSKFQRVMLKAGASDNYPFEWGGAHIRDAFIQSLSQVGKLKVDERSYEPCVLYANGEYWGVYEIREKVDDHDFTEYYYDQGKNDIDYIKTWGSTWAEYGSVDDWNDLYNFITTNNMAVQSNFEHVDSLLNWKSLIDYTVLNSYAVSKDWLNWNTSWWRGRNPDGDKKKWRYSLWDMDAIYGHYINFTGIPDESMNANPCDPEGFDNFGDPEGHMQILTSLIANDTINQWYVSRYIDLGNTLFTCDNLINHLDSLVTLIEPEMQAHCNKWGGTYNEWQQNVQAFRDSILKRCVTIDDGIVDCYNVDGPYPLVFDVEPPFSGEIKINSITPNDYAFNGDYFGNIDIYIEAQANAGFMFSHWEVVDQPTQLTTSTINPNGTLNITQQDSIIAHFIFADSVRYAFDVNPTGAGDIDINGTVPASYVHAEYLPEQSLVQLNAIGNPGYFFDHWETLNGTVLSSTNASTSFQALNPDSIVAFFNVIDSTRIAYDVNMQGNGDISINGTTPTAYEYVEYIIDGEPNTRNLEASAILGYKFDHWESINGTSFSPNTTESIVNITITQQDSIVAYFTLDQEILSFDVNPIGGGNIVIDGFVPTNYIYTDTFAGDQVLNLIATPNTNFTFSHWESTNGTTFSPNPNTENTQITVDLSDTIIAHFIRDTTLISFNVSPTATGTIDVENNNINTFVHSEYYPKGLPISIDAIPFPGFKFEKWDANFFNFSGALSSSSNSYLVDEIDTIIAHFLPEDSFIVVFDIAPTNDAGFISVNETDISSFPHEEKVPENTLLEFSETPNDNYAFLYWETINHDLNSSTSSTQSLFITSSDTITAIYERLPDRQASVPTGFSPNNDLNNDVLYVYGGQIAEIDFRIYDRWGQEMFFSSTQNKGWNGKVNGKNANAGVYYYKLIVTYLNGETESKSGDITLIR